MRYDRRVRNGAVSWMVLALSGFAGAVFSQDGVGAGSLRESPFRWRGAVPPDKRIQVLAVRSTIQVDGYDGDALEITALRRSAEADPEVVQIVLNETADRFQVVTQYPPPPLGPPRECLWYDPVRGNFWDYFVTVDLSLRVPRGQSLSVHTYSGDVRVFNLASSVVVATNDGTIRLAGLGGEIEARAEGDIVAQLPLGSPRSGSIRISVNGGTAEVVLLPLERLRIGSQLIVPDLTGPIELLRADGPFPAAIAGTLERDGRSLTVQVKRGSATVRALDPASPR